MLRFTRRTLQLMFGLFLYSLGISLTVQANIGLAPWDVFHQGLSKLLSIQIGQAAIVVGILVVILNVFLGENVGWGTIANGIFIGLFLDIILNSQLVPVFHHWYWQFLMATVGMLIIGVATALYLGAGVGSGPRDGLMMAIMSKTKLSVRLIRSSIELFVLIIGMILGGKVGIGTVYMGVTIGYFIQLAFKIMHFDNRKIRHRFIKDDYRKIKESM